MKTPLCSFWPRGELGRHTRARGRKKRGGEARRERGVEKPSLASATLPRREAKKCEREKREAKFSFRRTARLSDFFEFYHPGFSLLLLLQDNNNNNKNSLPPPHVAPWLTVRRSERRFWPQQPAEEPRPRTRKTMATWTRGGRRCLFRSLCLPLRSLPHPCPLPRTSILIPPASHRTVFLASGTKWGSRKLNEGAPRAAAIPRAFGVAAAARDRFSIPAFFFYSSASVSMAGRPSFSSR